MALSAGTARACITPPVGLRLGGYGSRDHGCEGVHDDLFAKALFLSDGDGEAAVITADLLGLRLVPQWLRRGHQPLPARHLCVVPAARGPAQQGQVELGLPVEVQVLALGQAAAGRIV